MEEGLPCFYQLFLDWKSSERLPIPSAFSERAGEEVPNNVFLRNISGKHWRVSVTKDGNKWYFDKGWKSFVEDNLVKLRDFFVFTFDGESSFDVKHYGENAIQKDFVEIASERMNPGKGENDGELENKQKRENHTKAAMEEETDEEGKNAEDAEVNDCIRNNNYLRRISTRKANNKKAEERGNDKESTIAKVRIYSKRGPYKRRALVGDDEDQDDKIFEYGVIQRPQNPYFLSKILTQIPKGLQIPANVIGDFGLELPKKLLVVDEKGSSFTLNATQWKDGRTWLSGGWKTFCYKNNMAKGDICICELVQGEESQNNIFMKVSIVRANSWLPKEDGMQALTLVESGKDGNN